MLHSLLLSLLPTIIIGQQIPLRTYIRALDEVTSHPVCPSNFHSCMKSNMCSSGTICTSSTSNSPCCTDDSNSCPSPLTMGITCNAQRSTNWCAENKDCGLNAKCCATGCGYNICLNKDEIPQRRVFFHSFPVAQFNADAADVSDEVLSDPNECPHPEKVPITCSATRPVDWCLRHDECPSTPSNRRLCCLTQCGHHVCMRRTSVGRWVIA